MTFAPDGDRRRPWPRLLAAMAFSWVCFAAMTVLAVWNEGRPGTKIADPVLDLFPYVPRVDAWNYWIWVSIWLGGVGALIVAAPRAAARMLVSCGIASLLRGVTVVLAGLGPVRGDDVNLAYHWDWDLRWQVIVRILNPVAVFMNNSAHIWLTKDTLFSGHTASTLLLVLYARDLPRLRRVFIAAHAVVVASLFYGHIHYTIDVVAAWVAAYTIYRVRERRGEPRRVAIPPSA